MKYENDFNELMISPLNKLTIETYYHWFVAFSLGTQNQNVFQGRSHCWTDGQAFFGIKG